MMFRNPSHLPTWSRGVAFDTTSRIEESTPLNGRVTGNRIMASLRLERLDALVKELSVQEDPEQLIRVFDRQADMIFRRDGLVTISRRDLEAPWYRITRSWRWKEDVYFPTDGHRLLPASGGLLGQLLYAGKPAVLN